MKNERQLRTHNFLYMMFILLLFITAAGCTVIELNFILMSKKNHRRLDL